MTKRKINSIYIGESAFRNFTIIDNNEKRLKNLSRINVFIGSNNSGKSRFLRTLFSEEDLGICLNVVDVEKINNIIISFKNRLEEYVEENGIDEYINLKSNLIPDIKLIKYINKDFTLKQIITPIDAILKIGIQEKVIQRSATEKVRPQAVYHTCKTLAKECLEELNISFPEEIPEFKYKKLYIPTLRGLRGYPGEEDKNFYLERTLKDYFSGVIDAEKRIFTGLNLYSETKRLLLGSSRDRARIRSFENFLSVNFFGAKEVNIIPSISDDVLHILIGKEECAIHQLGDGIQAVILLTYPLFFNQGENLLIFIEEPEHFLHPGFQRVFLETLMKEEFESFQYYITTHSNHFLDLTIDIERLSVFTFKKKYEDENFMFHIENVENEDSNILALIGVKNSSVFLSNCTIWVEGITDRIYIRKYLEVLQKEKGKKYIEDLHFSFVEYGGNNITHWSFLEGDDPNHKNINVEKLCGKLFLISDRDSAGLKKDGTVNPNSKKLLRHEELSNKLGDRYYCLTSREIENTLSSRVIRSVVEEYETKNDDLIISDFQDGEYQNKLIGRFIDSKLENSKHTFATNSGTISDKVTFAKKAISFINSTDDLTEEALTIAGKLYSFIESHNK